MRRRLPAILPDMLIIALLALLPLLMFWPQTVGGRTLIPTENVFQYEPFASDRDQAGAPPYPHNALVSDLILENYQWKSFIRDSIAQGEIPLWNPHQFAGIPFLASGQQSTLYPFSLLYYVLPLASAYGWFTVVQLWLAGVFMYAFTRGLGVSRPGAALAGIVYQLSAFFVISAVFQMVIAAAAWLPLVLLMIENIIRRRSALRNEPATIPWVIAGAVALGCNILAGHVEITYYTLIVAAYYAAFRLAIEWWNGRQTAMGPSILRYLFNRGVWLGVMVALGIALGAVQFLPLFELAGQNFRSGSASFQQVLDWAHPRRDVIQFALPNVFGGPHHNSYLDIFTGQTVPAPLDGNGQPVIDWGIKNYVEGALYLGILPLALSLFAVLHGWFAKWTEARRAALIFVPLGLFSLTVMFGLPTYAILFYTLPGINQLHSPFRWIFALTLCIAVLAGFGLDALTRLRHDVATPTPMRRWARRFGIALVVLSIVTLAGLLLAGAFFPQIEPFIERLRVSLARASDAYTDARMMFSHQFPNVLIFGLMTLGSGLIFLFAAHRRGNEPGSRLRLWPVFALALVAADLMIASWGFNPASDPALLGYTPPAVQWLMDQPGDWRYTTLDDPACPPLFNANLGMSHGLDDIRGYESIIPKQYVDFMEQIQPQRQLEFNRVAPLYPDEDGTTPLTSPLLDLLNVRYVVTYADTDVEALGWGLAYEDASVRIWERSEGAFLPRAYAVPAGEFDPAALAVPSVYTAAAITADTGRELFVDVETDAASWLVVSQSYSPGWRAFIRPQGSDDQAERPATVQLVQGNFQGVELPEPGSWTVRLVYSPQSFQVGAFASFMSGLVLLFMGGVWLWRLYVTPPAESHSTASRVIKNSLAPIALNLFNRAIDFAFAAVMLRVLGPEGSGIYSYAVIIFGWFDIFTNFGLNLFLTREVARDRSHARRYLVNTSALRLILALAGIPLIVVFLALRQTTVDPPLTPEALLAIGLLYVGLLPNSLSTGLSALFYAFERAEIPAAISTVATISKTVFGLAVLLMGAGVAGLAGVSIVTNIITLAIMLYSARGLLPKPQPVADRPLDGGLMRRMVGQSWPLMLNHFLASIFFQIDIIVIEAIHGAAMVGQYSVAYKWVLALNVIPSFFTQALLPVMSRQAHDDPASLRRSYVVAIRLLVSLALPFAVLFTVLAVPLTRILGGAEYLPDGAIALQLMIWSIPIGWMNSLTQYVLIALDLQRRITGAFILGVSFNLIMNLIFIPTYGYRAAAIITIASEAVLLVPFAILLQRSVGPLPWLSMIARPALAALVMLGILWIGWTDQPLLALVLACFAYALVWLALHPNAALAGLDRLRARLPLPTTGSGR